MARGKMIAAGVLLGIGVTIGLLNLSTLVDRRASADSKVLSAVALALFGVQPIAIGSGLVLSVQRYAKREQERLQAMFYQSVKVHRGKLTTLQFAIDAEISGTEAKAFLDDRAKEFNARFEVSEAGKILYCFDLAADSEQETYDVILEKPSGNWDSAFWGTSILNDVEGAVRIDLPANVRKQIKRGKYPVTIASGLSKEEAKQMRQALEAYSRLNAEIQPSR